MAAQELLGGSDKNQCSGPHNCEKAMTALHGDLTSGYWQEGTIRSCSCGQKWEHVCDEAEGCFWAVAS